MADEKQLPPPASMPTTTRQAVTPHENPFGRVHPGSDRLSVGAVSIEMERAIAEAAILVVTLD